MPMRDKTQVNGHSTRFPNLPLQPAAGEPRPLLRPRRSLVAVVIHDSNCPACAAYLESVAREIREFDAWDADVAVIIPRSVPNAPPANAPSLPLFYDPERQVEAAAGVEAPCVLVVDQW